MRAKDEKGQAPADSLTDRTRHVFDWYARGFLTEAEALHLIGDACLDLPSEERGQIKEKRNARTARNAV